MKEYHTTPTSIISSVNVVTFFLTGVERLERRRRYKCRRCQYRGVVRNSLGVGGVLEADSLRVA